MQEGRQFLDGVHAGRFDRNRSGGCALLACGAVCCNIVAIRFGIAVACGRINTRRSFHVGAVAAFRAQDDGILTGGRQKHEFMGQVSAHHT